MQKEYTIYCGIIIIRIISKFDFRQKVKDFYFIKFCVLSCW